MSYAKLVYGIGKLYSKHLRDNPYEEFPEFSGLLADFLDEEAQQTLADMRGERVIAYNDGQGTKHFIHVYIDEGTFEAVGAPEIPNIFGLSGSPSQE